MLDVYLRKLIDHHGTWRPLQAALVAGIVCFGAVIALKLLAPIRLEANAGGASVEAGLAEGGYMPAIEDQASINLQGLTESFRQGLFKSATALRDKPMADKTVERIRSQLKLRCIMEIGGEQVAYVNVKDIGLKKCKVGDSVNDLFTVLDINEKSVEITIVDHKIILSL